MIDPELSAKLDEIGAKADKAYHAAETVRKYLFWTGIISIVLIVLPLVGLILVLPAFMNNYVTPLNAMTGNSSSLQSTMNTLGL
ncbi:MAG TPA: hypothetical protein VMV38_02375 [Candidatus Paceibacterota bacterium]|nr:hypothetical protein [Candidatus Paceibacterota bacterium]